MDTSFREDIIGLIEEIEFSEARGGDITTRPGDAHRLRQLLAMAEREPSLIADAAGPYVRLEGISFVQVITADGLPIADAAKLVGQHIINGTFWPTVIRVPLRGVAPSSRCRCYRLRSGAPSDHTAVYEEDAFTPAQREIIAQAAVSSPPPLSCSA